MTMSQPQPFQLFIDGEFVSAASGEHFTVMSPVDGSDFVVVAKAGIADIDRAAAAAHRAFAGDWPHLSGR